MTAVFRAHRHARSFMRPARQRSATHRIWRLTVLEILRFAEPTTATLWRRVRPLISVWRRFHCFDLSSSIVTISPNGSQLVPLNLAIFALRQGVRSVGEMLSVTPSIKSEG
jgi:hypothetical protein